jgi:membrane-bound lytic murein transglycosylase D
MRRMRKLVKILLLFFIVVGLAGCAKYSYPYHPSSRVYKPSADLPANFPTLSTPNGNFWDNFRHEASLPSVDNQAVRAQVRWFQEHQYFVNYSIEKGGPYIYYVYQQTQKMGLPPELVLLPIIEGAYNPRAHSYAGAIGFWQFMRPTAHNFGIKMNRWYDGRQDIVASTNAALKYLAYLHYFFNNDWLLAIAAYNAGEGRIQEAILRNQQRNLPTDFWSLDLPRQTVEYVPKLLALSAILQDPARYDVKALPVNNNEYIDVVDVGGAVDLRKVAKATHLSLETVHNLNAGFLKNVTDPNGPYNLVLPKERALVLRDYLAMENNELRVKWQEHVVGRKEGLLAIANKYHTTLAELRDLNGLSSNRVRPHQVIMVPIRSGSSVPVSYAKNDIEVTADKPPVPVKKSLSHQASNKKTIAVPSWEQESGGVIAKPTTYLVRKGDTAFSVAKKFNLTVAELAKLNHLSGNGVQQGQVLQVGKAPIVTTVRAQTPVMKNKVVAVNKMKPNKVVVNGKVRRVVTVASTSPNLVGPKKKVIVPAKVKKNPVKRRKV